MAHGQSDPDSSSTIVTWEESQNWPTRLARRGLVLNSTNPRATDLPPLIATTGFNVKSGPGRTVRVDGRTVQLAAVRH